MTVNYTLMFQVMDVARCMNLNPTATFALTEGKDSDRFLFDQMVELSITGGYDMGGVVGVEEFSVPMAKGIFKSIVAKQSPGLEMKNGDVIIVKVMATGDMFSCVIKGDDVVVVHKTEGHPSTIL